MPERRYNGEKIVGEQDETRIEHTGKGVGCRSGYCRVVTGEGYRYSLQMQIS